MGKGRFVNQKLGKRTNRKLALLKSELASGRACHRPGLAESRFPKKGISREGNRRA